jgi:hypothetical protein
MRVHLPQLEGLTKTRLRLIQPTKILYNFLFGILIILLPFFAFLYFGINTNDYLLILPGAVFSLILAHFFFQGLQILGDVEFDIRKRNIVLHRKFVLPRRVSSHNFNMIQSVEYVSLEYPSNKLSLINVVLRGKRVITLEFKHRSKEYLKVKDFLASVKYKETNSPHKKQTPQWQVAFVSTIALTSGIFGMLTNDLVRKYLILDFDPGFALAGFLVGFANASLQPDYVNKPKVSFFTMLFLVALYLPAKLMQFDSIYLIPQAALSLLLAYFLPKKYLFRGEEMSVFASNATIAGLVLAIAFSVFLFWLSLRAIS